MSKETEAEIVNLLQQIRVRISNNLIEKLSDDNFYTDLNNLLSSRYRTDLFVTDSYRNLLMVYCNFKCLKRTMSDLQINHFNNEISSLENQMRLSLDNDFREQVNKLFDENIQTWYKWITAERFKNTFGHDIVSDIFLYVHISKLINHEEVRDPHYSK